MSHKFPNSPLRGPLLVAALLGLCIPALSWAGDPGVDEDRWVATGSDKQLRKTRGVGVGKGSYYGDRERGYFFYEDDPDALAEKPPEPPPPPGAPNPSKAEPEPEPMSVAWLKVKLEETKIAAIDNPTRDNVELYVYLQKIAMDKAEKFALMSQQVATVNPDLDESLENPTLTFARKTRMRVQEDEQSRVLNGLAKNTGIFYFFKSDCPYCMKQNPVLELMVREHGFRIMPVSVDHLGMADGSFPNWTPDQGQAEKLQVSQTPTLYLFHPPNEVVYLSVGLQSKNQLKKKILQVAHANKWIDGDEFDRAVRGLPRQFLADAVLDIGEVDWTNTTEAVNALRYASKRGLEQAEAGALGFPSAVLGKEEQATKLKP